VLFGAPDFDTNWVNLSSFSSVPAGYPIEAQGYKTITHNLGTENLYIYMETRDSDGSHGDVNRIYYARSHSWIGGYDVWDEPLQVPHIWWQNKTAQTIEILCSGPWPVTPPTHRVDQVRMRIWEIG